MKVKNNPEKKNPHYSCNLCMYKSNIRSNFVSHLKNTNHNTKKTIKKHNSNCFSDKKFKITKHNTLYFDTICDNVHTKKTDDYEHILNKFENINFKT